ncbi:hypothetical protein QFC21_002942 [Naganishia friedmannii]|uniref:Uncharacterized protein n=1 Tax=Naganishia friedmannii TaxID=89922 RepID=A0ACC2VUR5_9TREE|nr:hypothetical protein QFC21_002942 [Naganishia friedmannii]
MGLLSLGTPLSWPDTKALADHVREHGITQFLYTWDRWAGRKGEPLLWGDEIEYIVVSLLDDKKRASLSLRQSEILEELKNVVGDLCDEQPEKSMVIPTFHPEYGMYMLESTPGCPLGPHLKDLVGVEANMRFRRKLARSHLRPNEVPMTITSFPRLGVTDQPFTDPECMSVADSPASQSLFVGKGVTNPHARFPTLTGNIRSRRGSKVAINVPIYKDTNTPSPFVDPTIPYDRQLWPGDSEAKNGAAKPDHIYMDAMAFGMGCCCLQITFQAFNVDEARRMYDALVPVAPIMLALTACSPAFRGYLADVDARWDVIAGSVDDRTEEERGLKPLKNDKYRIPKSRYDSVDCYIANDVRNKAEFNDISCPINDEVFQRLRAHGIDEALANHVAHLFIRDPLVIFSERVDQDDEDSMDHFENIQSTNWQTIRFKPPPPNSNIAWRVEFRSMEVQLTDFENAAFSIFIVLLTRAILSFNLNFYMPISQVDENMHRAQKRNAAREQKFHFRKWVFPLGKAPAHMDCRSRAASPNGFRTSPESTENNSSSVPHSASTASFNLESDSKCTSPSTPHFEVDDETEEMTLDELINGKAEFPGLLGVVNAYVNSLNVDVATKCDIRKYLNLIKERAAGKLVTPAAWIRNFITSHPEYKHDSVVSEVINYDLLKAIDEV